MCTSPLVYVIFVQVVSSRSNSSSVSSDASSSDMESLKDVPFRSTSVTDLPTAADLVLNISHHSEPESLKQVSSVWRLNFLKACSHTDVPKGVTNWKPSLSHLVQCNYLCSHYKQEICQHVGNARFRFLTSVLQKISLQAKVWVCAHAPSCINSEVHKFYRYLGSISKLHPPEECKAILIVSTYLCEVPS